MQIILFDQGSASMNLRFRSKPIFVCFVFLSFWLMLSSSLSAAQYDDDVSSKDSQFVKGMINTISPADRSITIKQKKGPGITVRINAETELSGVEKFENLQVRQMIKLWYRPEQGGNTALKIVKLPDMGC